MDLTKEMRRLDREKEERQRKKAIKALAVTAIGLAAAGWGAGEALMYYKDANTTSACETISVSETNFYETVKGASTQGFSEEDSKKIIDFLGENGVSPTEDIIRGTIHGERKEVEKGGVYEICVTNSPFSKPILSVERTGSAQDSATESPSKVGREPEESTEP